MSNWYHLGPPWKLICSPCPYLYLVLYLLIENYYNRSHLKSFYVADFLSFFIYWGGNTPIIYYFIIYIKGKFLPMCSKYIHTGVVCSCILGLVWFLFLFSSVIHLHAVSARVCWIILSCSGYLGFHSRVFCVIFQLF